MAIRVTSTAPGASGWVEFQNRVKRDDPGVSGLARGLFDATRSAGSQINHHRRVWRDRSCAPIYAVQARRVADYVTRLPQMRNTPKLRTVVNRSRRLAV